MSDSSAPRPLPVTKAGSPAPSPAEQAQALHDRIGQLVKGQRRADRDLALSLARMQADKLHQHLGYARLAEYGQQALGFRASKTRQLARLGRMLPDLPALDVAMRAGALGWTKARTVIQVATPQTVEAWVLRALDLTSRELEDQVARTIRGDLPPDDPEEDWQPPRYVWARFRLDPYHFELLMKAIGEIRHHLGDADVSASQCLLWMAERCLDGDLFEVKEVQEAQEAKEAQEGEDEDEGEAKEGESEDEPEETTHVCHGENAFAERYRIIERRCPACDKAWTEGRVGKIEMLPEERAMVECDAEIVAGDDSGSSPPGHVSRTIPPATRKAVLIRDGMRCQTPGCRCKRHLELHHVLMRSAGGPNEAWNLVTVCSTHHDLIHKDVLHVSHGPGGQLVWERAGGQPLGLFVCIWGESRELTQDHLSEFEGPPGSWPCIEGYWGQLEPPPGFEAAHVCRCQDPRDRYPRGGQQFRIGDELQMAPAWMERNLGVG